MDNWFNEEIERYIIIKISTFLYCRQEYKKTISNHIKWVKLKLSADFKTVGSSKVYWILVIDGDV